MNDIVFDARMINKSGIGSYIKAILPELVQRYDCVILGDKNEITKIIPNHKNIINFNANIYSISEQFLFSKFTPESLLFWSPHYNVPIFKTKAKKQLTTIHDVYHLAFQDRLRLIERIYAKLIFNKVIKKSNKIITVSKFSQKEILKYTQAKPENIKVIYNAIHPNICIDEYDNDRTFKEDYILYVGNVKPHKNLKNLIKAFQILKENDSKLKLIIIGKKEGFINSDTDVVDLSKNLKDVIFTGFLSQKDLISAYRKAKLLVLPSLYEGFGYPIIEAMYNNTPVILSDIEVFREVSDNSSVYFNPNDPNDIAEKILKVADSEELNNELIDKGTLMIKKRYTHKLFIKNHFEVIDSLLWD